MHRLVCSAIERFFQRLLISSCLLLSPAVSAQEKPPPQVLFLGDQVHGAIVRAAAKELGDQVRIHYPQGGGVHDSGSALMQSDHLLGETKWDIIYFNFGIGDLFYKDPSTREIRIMCKHGGGVRVSTPEQYEERLDALVQRLKATGAKLVWGNTTPMVNVHFFPSYQGNLFDAGAEQEYNAIAARVMAKHKVPVLDLHGHVMAHFKPDENHPAYTQYAKEMENRGHPLHAPLVRALLFTAREPPPFSPASGPAGSSNGLHNKSKFLEGSSATRQDSRENWIEEMLKLNRDHGVKILGGCCGTDDSYLRGSLTAPPHASAVPPHHQPTC